jgi:hypothetical protein
MTKKIFRNSSNQPIYLNLPGGRSLKIPARGEAEVEEADVASNEMALHLSRGSAVLTEPEATGEAAATQEQKSETKTEAGSQPAGKVKDEEGGKG